MICRNEYLGVSYRATRMPRTKHVPLREAASITQQGNKRKARNPRKATKPKATIKSAVEDEASALPVHRFPLRPRPQFGSSSASQSQSNPQSQSPADATAIAIANEKAHAASTANVVSPGAITNAIARVRISSPCGKLLVCMLFE
jgi:hypothetical protein